MVSQLIAGMRSRSKTFITWSGAGVSRSPPADRPLGIELTNAWLEEVCSTEALSAIRSLKKNHIELVRLERVVDDTRKCIGDRALQALGSLLNTAPNENHEIIAELIAKQSAPAFTLNFDDGVERAYQHGTLNVETPAKTLGHTTPRFLYKLHGAVGDADIGATLSNISKGLSEGARVALDTVLYDDRNVIVFVGYSASDYFDIEPFFNEKPRLSLAAGALWVCHQQGPMSVVKRPHWKEAGLTEGALSILGAFGEAHVVAADTRDVLRMIIGRTALPGGSYQSGIDWKSDLQSRLSLSEIEKLFCSAQILHAMGWGRKSLDEILRYLQKGGDLAIIYNLLSESSRQAGFFQLHLALLEQGWLVGVSAPLWKRARAVRMTRRRKRAAVLTLLGAARSFLPFKTDLGFNWARPAVEATIFFKDSARHYRSNGTRFTAAVIGRGATAVIGALAGLLQARMSLLRSQMGPFEDADFDRALKFAGLRASTRAGATTFRNVDSIMGLVNVGRETATDPISGLLRKATLTADECRSLAEAEQLLLKNVELSRDFDDLHGASRSYEFLFKCASKLNRNVDALTYSRLAASSLEQLADDEEVFANALSVYLPPTFRKVATSRMRPFS